MRSRVAGLVAALFALSFAAQDALAQPPSPTDPEHYLVTSELIKDGVSLAQHQNSVLAGQTMPYSLYTETPYISGISRNASAPGKPVITKNIVKSGYAYAYSCLPGGLRQPGKVVCHVQVDVAENLTPQATAKENQEQIENSIKHGDDILALPTVHRDSWKRDVVLAYGEKVAIMMDHYQFDLQVDKAR